MHATSNQRYVFMDSAINNHHVAGADCGWPHQLVESIQRCFCTWNTSGHAAHLLANYRNVSKTLYIIMYVRRWYVASKNTGYIIYRQHSTHREVSLLRLPCPANTSCECNSAIPFWVSPGHAAGYPKCYSILHCVPLHPKWFHQCHPTCLQWHLPHSDLPPTRPHLQDWGGECEEGRRSRQTEGKVLRNFTTDESKMNS